MSQTETTSKSAADVDLHAYAVSIAGRTAVAARQLAVASSARKSIWLRNVAELLRTRSAEILAANARDLEAAPEYGLSSAAIDRLRLTEARLNAIADAVDDVDQLPDPVGEVIESTRRPNGLAIQKVRVPLGVVFFIFESRPNVTIDAAALCVKSGNGVILRGGKEAFHSNQALYVLLREALRDSGLPEEAVQMVETTERAVVGELLRLPEQINVTIPRGGKSLIERVTAEARMPVIKHYDGICHVYVDQAADLEMAVRIIVNSKCQRPGVCNAAETLLVHEDVAAEFLPLAAVALREKGVELRGCPRTQELVADVVPATDEDFRTEYLALVLSVRVVQDLEAAMTHIAEYGSHHTDVIVTNDLRASRTFLAMVDSSAVMVNASTRFNDGGEFGLGAEIGISTDKFHARGPCGLRELTSYKYVVQGDGQIRE